LEEVGDVHAARQHLRQAVRLDPNYPDAQYNLAYVCEKLDAFAEAREHWQTYLKLDSAGPWSTYARQRLSSSIQAISAGNI
jgi:Tfp pilus assembly protein PilF